jgi:hypothetical protein
MRSKGRLKNVGWKRKKTPHPPPKNIDDSVFPPAPHPFTNEKKQRYKINEYVYEPVFDAQLAVE